MLLCLWLAKNDSQVRIVMAAGSTVLLALSVYLVFAFLEARETMPAEKFPFLFGYAIPWFKPLHIFYRTGVDVFPLVHAPLNGCLRLLHLRGLVHHVHVL